MREIDSPVADGPAALVCELDDGTFAVEEEEVLGVGDGQGSIGVFGAGGDFGADRANENLCWD